MMVLLILILVVFTLVLILEKGVLVWDTFIWLRIVYILSISSLLLYSILSVSQILSFVIVAHLISHHEILVIFINWLECCILVVDSFIRLWIGIVVISSLHFLVGFTNHIKICVWLAIFNFLIANDVLVLPYLLLFIELLSWIRLWEFLLSLSHFLRRYSRFTKVLSRHHWLFTIEGEHVWLLVISRVHSVLFIASSEMMRRSHLRLLEESVLGRSQGHVMLRRFISAFLCTSLAFL